MKPALSYLLNQTVAADLAIHPGYFASHHAPGLRGFGSEDLVDPILGRVAAHNHCHPPTLDLSELTDG